MKLQITVWVFWFLQVNSYHQTDYRLIHERVALEGCNPSYVKHLQLFLFHYTRYEKRLNVTGTLLQDLGDGITSVAQVYKYQSNEYREFPVLYKDNVCDTWKHDVFKVSPVHYDTNVARCPIKKGPFYLYNAGINDTNLPPFALRGRYMVDLKIYYNLTILMGHGKWYGEIEATNPLEHVIHG